MVGFGGIETQAGRVAIDLLVQYGFLALFLFTFFETSMTFPLLPSELVVPAAAALLIGTPATFVAFVLAAAAGGTVGSLFAYYVFGTASSRLLDRFGEYVRVSDRDVERGQRWFRRWGESAVLWGRFLPVLRSAISIPAGFAGMNVGKFAVYSGTGTGSFAAIVAALVVFGFDGQPGRVLADRAGPALAAVVAYAVAHPPFGIAAVLLALFVVLLARNAYDVRCARRS